MPKKKKEIIDDMEEVFISPPKQKTREDVLNLHPLPLFKLFFAIHRLTSHSFDSPSSPSPKNLLKMIREVSESLGIPIVEEANRLKTKEDMMVFIPNGTVFLEAYDNEEAF